jgi:hypothetical protein
MTAFGCIGSSRGMACGIMSLIQRACWSIVRGNPEARGPTLAPPLATPSGSRSHDEREPIERALDAGLTKP